MRPSVFQLVAISTLFVAALLCPPSLHAQSQAAAYRLETLEVFGTERITKEQVATELGLKADTLLNEDVVVKARERLLGLGLFKNAALFMRRGSKPGYVHLIFQIEDDPTVLTPWALGAEVGVTFDESQTAASTNTDTPPLGYRLNLVGRNFFDSMHRGSAFADIDGVGVVREGRLSYGLPRFSREDVQFDAEVSATDVQHRYLNALGFGSKIQGLWTRDVGLLGSIQFGPAMYLNRAGRFGLPKFPESLAGPKVAIGEETRLLGFFPGNGHAWSASLLIPPMQSKHSILELGAAHSIKLADLLVFTIDGKVLTIGKDGYAARAEGRLDVPLQTMQNGDQAGLFLRLRSGSDEFDTTHLKGSAGIFGVRYHSAGIIAELSFQITRAPSELAPDVAKSERGP